MEPQDLELIERIIPHHPELRALMREHELLEEKLESYQGRYLSPEEAMEKKRLQKIKLAGKDRIEAILSRYRGLLEKEGQRLTFHADPTESS
jgi:hypothetical protein